MQLGEGLKSQVQAVKQTHLKHFPFAQGRQNVERPEGASASLQQRSGGGALYQARENLRQTLGRHVPPPVHPVATPFLRHARGRGIALSLPNYLGVHRLHPPQPSAHSSALHSLNRRIGSMFKQKSNNCSVIQL